MCQRCGLPTGAGTVRLASKLVAVVSRRTSLNAGPDSPRSASRLAQPAFAPRRLAHYRTVAERVTGELLDTALARSRTEGRFDLVRDLASPLPIAVISALLDVTGLPALPSDRTYQLWAIAGEQPRSLGVLPEASAGEQQIVAAQTQAGENVVAITAEPAGGSEQPTLPILWQATLAS